MNTKLIIVPAAALAFAMLPSCTSTGGIDPDVAKAFIGLGEDYLDHREQEKERDYQRFLDLKKAKQQPVDPVVPETPETEEPEPVVSAPLDAPATTPVSITAPDADSEFDYP